MRNKLNEEAKQISKVFVQNVRIVCEKKNLNIGDVEDKGGVSAGYLSRLYAQGSLCGLYNAFCIARAVEVPLDDLLNRDFYKEERIKELEEE